MSDAFMNAREELNPEIPDDAAAAAAEIGESEATAGPKSDAEPAHSGETFASAAQPDETHPAETLGAAPTASAHGDGAPSIDPPQLHLIPYLATAKAEAPPRPPRATRWASGVAAGLAAVLAVSAVGLYDHSRQSNLIAAKASESVSLAQTVESLKERIDAIETARSRDEMTDLRKVATEIKAERDATHDLNGALAQLTAHVDRVDHDESARLDKLADRIDHDSSARLAELAARIDKLEKRAPAAVVAAVTPTPMATPAPKPAASPIAVKPDPLVSNETTGSIDKPKSTLRGYWLLDVQGDYALVGGRDGPQQVGPGDFLPGAGRVLRIERRGRDWVVITTAGLIAGDQSRF